MDMESFLEILYNATRPPRHDTFPFGDRLDDELFSLRRLLNETPEAEREELRRACEGARNLAEKFAFAQGVRFTAKLLFAALSTQ